MYVCTTPFLDKHRTHAVFIVKLYHFDVALYLLVNLCLTPTLKLKLELHDDKQQI